MFEYVMIGLAIVGAIAVLAIAMKLVVSLFEWFSDILKFYKEYGSRRSFMAKIKESDNNHFEFAKWDGYINPTEVGPVIERLEWIRDNTEHRVNIKDYGRSGLVTVSFINDGDAIAFKLRWS